MVRVLKLLFLLLFLFFIYQIFILFFVKEHEVTYKIGTGKETYEVHETFKIVDKKHLYTFKVQNQKNKYYFQMNENFHKQDRVIKKIESYQKDNLACIYPVFKKKTQSEIICQKEKQQVVGTYLSTIKDDSLSSFQKQLEKKGYLVSKWHLDNQSSQIGKVTYYQQNILPKQAFYFWTYQGIVSFTNKKDPIEVKLFDSDQYENDKSIVVGDTLVIIDKEEDYDFDKIYLLSLFSKKKEEIKLKTKISQDSYFLGSVNNKVYLIDRKNIKQYEIDIRKKSAKIVGNKELNARYYDGKTWTTRNIYDFVKEDILLKETIPSSIKKRYPNAQIWKQKGCYYLVEGNSVSLISSEYPQQRINLFSLDDLKEVKVEENMVFAVSKDTVYAYSFQTGLFPILKSRELLFHTANMYGVAFKDEHLFF